MSESESISFDLMRGIYPMTGEAWMHTTPLVSAVIPTRNRPELVCRAVRSALNQTYPNLEVVVVIDGPDEATLERLTSLREDRLHVVALSENVGGSEARNRGIQKAQGQFIAMLDDDDEWLSEKIGRQLEAALEVPSAMCVVTSRHRLVRPGMADRILPRRAFRVNEDVSEYMFYESSLRRPAYGPQTSTFFASKALFTAVPFRKGLRCHQDWEWLLRVLSLRGVQHRLLNDPLCIVHEHTNTSSITRATQWRDSLDWLESSASHFTPRAYASFVVRQCMFRCAETKHRLRLFLELLGRCRSRGYLDVSLLLIAARWYIFSPKMRSRITQLKTAFQPR